MIRLHILTFMSAIILRTNAAVEFYRFGTSAGDSALARRDDAFTTITISTNLPFFGKIFNMVHVSTNGIIFFGQGSTSYTPTPFPLNGTLCVAAYWTDSDPSRGGNIFYREVFESDLLRDLSSKVRQKFIEQYSFQANWALLVTYSNVSRFDCGSTCYKVVNHQTVLLTDGIKTFVIFLYKRLDYTNAQIGFNAGDGKRFYLVEGSNKPSISVTALTDSNVGVPGQWMFAINDDIRGACNLDGLLNIYPRKLAFFENEEFEVSGPCFGNNDTSISIFIEKTEVVCTFNNLLRLKCKLPFMDKTGIHKLNFVYDNITYSSFLLIHDINDRKYTKYSINAKVAGTVGASVINWDKSQFGNIDKVSISGYEIIYRLTDDFQIVSTEMVPISLKNISNTGETALQSNNIQKRSLNNFFKIVLVAVRGLSPAATVLAVKSFISSSDNRCQSWHSAEPSDAEMQSIIKRSSKVNPCQPSVSKDFPAFLPNGFKQDTACNPSWWSPCYFFHNTAYSCYRSTNNANTGGIATQCCYSENGDLLLGPTSGGTLDFKDSDVSWFQHNKIDVYPYLLCCVFSDHCDLYYDKRPSIDSKYWTPPRPIRASGDPHFLTMDGTEYDFNPIGEFIYFKTDDTIFQARISQYVKANGNMAQACYFSAFALKYSNGIILEIKINIVKEISLFVNQTEVDLGNFTLGDILVNFATRSKIVVQIISGINIEITASYGILNIITSMSLSLKGKVSGLVGNWDDDRTNDYMLPNGSYIPLNSSIQDIHYKFGMSWATTESTSLFSYPDGLRWSDFQNKNFAPFFGVPLPNLACGSDQSCLFDLHVTGNVNVSKTNIIIKNQTDQIVSDLMAITQTCITLINIQNANLNINIKDSMYKYNLSCITGYSLQGESYMECFQGNYTGSLGKCNYVEKNNSDFVKIQSLFTLLLVIILQLSF